MSLIEAIVLGIVQGLTEFIPISSDGHLALVPYMFGWAPPTLPFVVAVHLGTVIALIAAFREDLLGLIRTVLGWKSASPSEQTLVKLIAIASVPGVIAGIVLKGTVASLGGRPMIAAAFLLLGGWFLLASERRGDARTEPRIGIESLAPRGALWIGAAQAFAIMPGISRSGWTIGTGVRLGLERSIATRFSFLMGIPITVGALIFETPDILDAGIGGEAVPFIVGIITSGVVGFMAIRWLLTLLRTHSLRPFGAYCVTVALLSFIVGLAKG